MKSTLATLFICSFLFLSTELVAQSANEGPAGARGSAMGDASVTYQDIYSSISNQAGLAYLDNLSFMVFGERRFFVSEINSLAFAAAYPTNSGTFGLGVNYFGFNEYNEQKIGLSYARLLFEDMSIGAQINYLGTNIPEYGNRATATFELGTQARIVKKFILGAHVFSPLRVKVSEEDRIPTVITLGGAFIPSDKVIVALEYEQDLDYKPMIKAGIEYQVVQQFEIRVGVSTNPTLNSFGIGINLKTFEIDLSASYHQALGITSGLSLAYTLNKEEKATNIPTKDIIE